MATPASDPTDLLDVDEAAAVLGVEVSRVEVMVADGLLTVASHTDGRRLFDRAEVEAVRLAGA